MTLDYVLQPRLHDATFQIEECGRDRFEGMDREISATTRNIKAEISPITADIVEAALCGKKIIEQDPGFILIVFPEEFSVQDIESEIPRIEYDVFSILAAVVFEFSPRRPREGAVVQPEQFFERRADEQLRFPTQPLP